MTIIAIHNYGRERKKDVGLNRAVPAYKLGGQALAECLVAALAPLARLVKVARQGTYYYVQVHDDARFSLDNKQGFLTFTVADERLPEMEAITRAAPAGRQIFRWDENSETWLRFPDRGHADYWTDTASWRVPDFRPYGRATLQTTDYLTGSGLKARRSQRSPEDEPWWWISGETRPHAATFRSAGCRWSKKRTEWYFIGEELPAAVLALFGEEAQSHNLVPATDEPGESTLNSHPTKRPPGSVDDADPIISIQITEEPIEATDNPFSTTSSYSTKEEVPPPQPASPEAIWKAKDSLEDVIQWAEPAPAVAIPSDAIQPVTVQNGMYHIPMQYVGRVSVSGECMVFGAAINGGTPVYLNLTGAGTAVEAVWARLAQGKELYLSPDRGASIPLQPTEKGLYTRFQRKLGTLDTEHLILLHRDLLDPTYAELSCTYLIRADDEQFTHKLGEHINRLVNIPVFPEWYPYLAQIAERTETARRVQCYGGLDVWALTLDQARWTQTITLGLEQGAIRLPGSDRQVAAAVETFLQSEEGG